MHYGKYKGKADVRRVLEHADRGQEGVADHEHSNELIDPERTYLNYELKDRGGLSAIQYHRQRIEQIAAETKERTGKAIRKDAILLCSWMVTAPKSLPKDKQAEFFKGAYEWFSKRYGEDNIVTAAVHLDETSPHMHLQFTPIVEKKGVRRLCARDLETPQKLQQVHPQLQKVLTKQLGCPVELLNGATDGGNKTVNELKAKKLEKKVEELQKEVEELKTARSEEVFAKAGAIKAIGEKLTGNKKLTADEVETVKNVAATVEQIQAEFQRRIEEAEQSKKVTETLQNELQATLEQEQDKIQAEAQMLSGNDIARSKRLMEQVKEQASAEIAKMRQEKDGAVKKQEALKEQLKQAMKLATDYVYLVGEMELPPDPEARKYLKGQIEDYESRWKAMREPEQKEEQKQTEYNYPSLE